MVSQSSRTTINTFKYRWLNLNKNFIKHFSFFCLDPLSNIDTLIREYNFQDWQTITVLVRIGNNQLNEYISGTIVDIPRAGYFIVAPTLFNKNLFPNRIEINLFENLFGILSDNAPPIRELIEGKHVLCRRQQTHIESNCKYSIYQSGIILEKTLDAKFQILLDQDQETVSLPRQSIRLFLPPWHDGLYFSIVFFFS